MPSRARQYLGVRFGVPLPPAPRAAGARRPRVLIEPAAELVLLDTSGARGWDDVVLSLPPLSAVRAGHELEVAVVEGAHGAFLVPDETTESWAVAPGARAVRLAADPARGRWWLLDGPPEEGPLWRGTRPPP